MKIGKTIALAFVALPVLIVGVFFVWPKEDYTPSSPTNLPISTPARSFSTTEPSAPSPSTELASPETQTTYLYQPTVDFASRVTKKPFAIYVTPENSPITPERFTGWHTGADAEYEDITAEVTVHAISNGTVRSSRRANGYGGIVVIEHTINNQTLLVIYGHLDPTSLIRENSSVTAGQQIGILGKGGTDETDGERKHLHLGILSTPKLNVRGYVDSPTKLTDWLDPLTFFKL